MGARASTRSARIDALRGFAVFGILLINAWGFVYGYTMLRYGVVPESAPAADRLAVLFAAAFAEQKFYPIFSFLFGAGFALQMRSLERAHGLEGAKGIYRRRLRWLLAVGLLHGTLLWFGDILVSYAITGFWLLAQAGERLRELARWLRILAVTNFCLLLLTALLMAMIATSSDSEVGASALEAHAVYAYGSWSEVARERLRDFGGNLGGFWLFLPRLALLFLLGVFAVRCGWLTRPERHRTGWRRILAAGLLVALPLNLWWGYAALTQSLAPDSAPGFTYAANVLLELSGPALGAAYIAVFMLAGGRTMAVLSGWLAPVGRMALSNYIGQSVSCGLLLHAWGLGLGALISRAQLIALCAAIMLAQVLLSRWWMARHQQGPLEALWRRFTYTPSFFSGAKPNNQDHP